jgi:predicted transcriptional regulator
LALEKRGRDRLSIIAEILEIGLEGTVKTNIMYRANLSFLQLNTMLDFLQYLGLLEAIGKEGRTIYKTTEKGLDYIQSFREVQDLVSKALASQRVKPQELRKKPETVEDIRFHSISHALDELKADVGSLDARVQRLERRLVKEEKCPACGREIQPSFRLCPYCGRQLLEFKRTDTERNLHKGDNHSTRNLALTESNK